MRWILSGREPDVREARRGDSYGRMAIWRGIQPQIIKGQVVGEAARLCARECHGPQLQFREVFLGMRQEQHVAASQPGRPAEGRKTGKELAYRSMVYRHACQDPSLIVRLEHRDDYRSSVWRPARAWLED